MMMLKMMQVMLRMEETRRIRMKQRAAKWKEQVARNCGQKYQIMVNDVILW